MIPGNCRIFSSPTAILARGKLPRMLQSSGPDTDRRPVGICRDGLLRVRRRSSDLPWLALAITFIPTCSKCQEVASSCYKYGPHNIYLRNSPDMQTQTIEERGIAYPISSDSWRSNISFSSVTLRSATASTLASLIPCRMPSPFVLRNVIVVS